MRRLLLIVLAAALVAGCGEQRTAPLDLEHAVAPEDVERVTLEEAGVSFRAPGNWQPVPPSPPLQGGITSRTAIVAVWRYPRTEPLPTGRGQLAKAQRRLVQRVRERNATFALRDAELTTYDGARAIELTGRQTIGGVAYDVRSAHIFRGGAEIVVDAYAPPADFDRVDDSVFTPLLASLKVKAL